ncbi:MAG: hypothetical protein AAB626_02765 [Patescibacteria group bacterium]
MTRATRNLINIILALIVISILGGLGYLFFSSGESFVPENFAEARIRSSAIALELTSGLDLSRQSLNKISEEDRNGRFSSALELVEKEIEKIEKVKIKALELAAELTNMAQAVQGIEPASARNLAFEAVSQEVSLIMRLNNYLNFSFNPLLETLRLKFSGDIRYDSGDVQILIGNMNKEAKEINYINDSFNQKLKDFDKVL